MNDAVFKALAHPVRREVLRLLREGPMTAGQLSAEFDVSKPTMSGHFALLKEAGLITPEREGVTIHYRLNISVAEEAAAALMALTGAAPRSGGENA